MTITFGDNVRVLSTPETRTLGVENRTGQVLGITTPSVTQVEVIGKLTEDVAICVSFEDLDDEFWFCEELLEFEDFGAGTEIVIGNIKSVRQSDGSWKETLVRSPKKKWQFWLKNK